MNLLFLLLPEIILVISASALFLLGISPRAAARRVAPMIALAALLAVFVILGRGGLSGQTRSDRNNIVQTSDFVTYIQMLASGVGLLFVLLSWPTDEQATGNSAISFGTEAGEYFGLLLLSIAGVFLVASANDLILLFLGIELASIPTYIMVSVSRPIPAAQEAGVKYFFLGAMAAAIMLFGFSYLYGTTGTTSINEISTLLAKTKTWDGGPTQLTAWQMLAAVMLIAGFAFKLAAVPLHFYAADVYQGAATPITALLSFVPKTSGLVALLKILACMGGGTWAVPPQIAKLIWVMAVLTMSIGNVLGLLQLNVKRVLACSSIAHSGYMLVGVAALCNAGGDVQVRDDALLGILFYLAAYGIVNAAAFGVLILLPSRDRRPATSAETFEDLAGTGRGHPILGLAMAVACFSLIGLPLTVGFFGKFYLIRPALLGHNYWLVGITMANAAVSAAYYLKIVATMFLRTEPAAGEIDAPESIRSVPIGLAVTISVLATLIFGSIFPATAALNRAAEAAQLRGTDETSSAPLASGGGSVVGDLSR